MMGLKRPVCGGQREQCLAARGNLTQTQAAKVAGVSYSTWCRWENETAGAEIFVLQYFRAAAKAMYPHYRSDLWNPK